MSEARWIWSLWRLPLCLVAAWVFVWWLPLGPPVPQWILILGWGSAAGLTALFLLWLVLFALAKSWSPPAPSEPGLVLEEPKP